MRFLVVFAKSRWEVIDVHNNCEIMDHGSYDKMMEFAEELNKC